MKEKKQKADREEEEKAKKRRKKEKVAKKEGEEKAEKKHKKEKKKSDEKKRKGKRRSKKAAEAIKKEPSVIDLNVYNLLFDEINLFLKEIPRMSSKKLKQRLILIDGKMLWLEKQSELQLTKEEGADDIIDLELKMLEMGVDLESAEEFKMAYAPAPSEFDLEALKEELKSPGDISWDVGGLLEDFDLDDIDKPMEDLESKFLLFELRGIMEKAINEVFTMEGKMKGLKVGEDDKRIKAIRTDQKRAAMKHLKEIIGRLKKEKPKMILTEEKIAEFRQISHKEIAEMKAQEEQEFEEMVEELLD